MSARRFSVSPLWWLLFCLALLLAQAGTPLRAQTGHEHEWTVYNEPTAYTWVTHIGGQAVTSEFPARPCEVLQININTFRDADKCIKPGCPIPNGIVEDLSGKVKRWRDNAPGHFGYLLDGHFRTSEEIAEDGLTYGTGDSRYYRVDRDRRAPYRILIEPEIDDDFQSTDTVGANDVPVWNTGYEFPVAGGPCDIKDKREVSPGQHST